MINLILFLAGIFFITFILGRLLEKIRIPWVFSALITGLVLAAYNPFKAITSSESFIFLAQLGMYFILFIIGFEINLDQIRKHKGFIVRSTIAIIAAEAFVGVFFVHYVFDVSWLISLLVAISFATVGEAVLIPILEEFKLIKSDLGQTILGIGVLDDIVEIITVVALITFLGLKEGHGYLTISMTLIVMVVLFSLAYFFTKWHPNNGHIQFKGVASFFLFVIAFIFLFVGIGLIAEAAALGAILSGVALKNFIPKKKWNLVDSEVHTMAYGFFAPLFFLWVGLDTDVSYLIKVPFLVLAVIGITNLTKITTSYFMGRNVLGKHKSIILGISLSVKFSTSIVIIKLLFDNSLIPLTLYSVLVGATILFKFIVPFLLSHLITKWKIIG